jgi:hypothetical protein
VGFLANVYADGFTVRETYGNGFVSQVDVLDTSNVLHTVFTGPDTSTHDVPFDFSVNFARTSYLVKGLKVYVNALNSPSWEEIDAIQLRGDDTVAGGPAPVPEPSSLALLVAGSIGTFGYRRFRRKTGRPA